MLGRARGGADLGEGRRRDVGAGELAREAQGERARIRPALVLHGHRFHAAQERGRRRGIIGPRQELARELLEVVGLPLIEGHRGQAVLGGRGNPARTRVARFAESRARRRPIARGRTR